MHACNLSIFPAQTNRTEKLLRFFFSPTLNLVTVSVILAPLLRVKLDQSVDPHDRHASLDSTLELLNLAHARLEHTGLDAVVHAALGEIEAVVAVALGLGDGFVVGVGGRLGLLRGR